MILGIKKQKKKKKKYAFFRFFFFFFFFLRISQEEFPDETNRMLNQVELVYMEEKYLCKNVSSKIGKIKLRKKKKKKSSELTFFLFSLLGNQIRGKFVINTNELAGCYGMRKAEVAFSHGAVGLALAGANFDYNGEFGLIALVYGNNWKTTYSPGIPFYEMSNFNLMELKKYLKDNPTISLEANIIPDENPWLGIWNSSATVPM